MGRTARMIFAATVGCMAALWCSLSPAEGEDRKLMEREWRKGRAEELRAMTVGQIRSVQVFGLTAEGKKEYREHAVTTERNSPQVEALLQAAKRARPFSIPRGVPRALCPPNRTLVVEPVNGEPFEFAYSDYLHEPFAGIYSLELKEALYALGGGDFPVTVIHLKDSQVKTVVHAGVIAPHRGGIGGGNLSAELHLTPQAGISLWVKLSDNGKLVMEGESPMHFGDAKVFASGEAGIYIVLLHKPQY